jgi:hypothetical protein
MPTIHEQLSEQFRKWELRGRGWLVYDEPVFPEPPFVRFNGHYQPESPVIDDGRRPTLLSSLVQRVSRKLSPEPPPLPPLVEEEPQPISITRGRLVELSMSLPADLDMEKAAFEQMFGSLGLCHEPVAFELIGTHARVLAQFVVGECDAALVRKQLGSRFPKVQFSDRTGTLDKAWNASAGEYAFAIEFGLHHEFFRPLSTDKSDPFVGIVAALSELQPSELALFQVLFQPVQNEWAESILDSVTHSDGKPFFVNAPELLSAAEKKVSKPLFAAVVRIMARAQNESRLGEIARDLASSLRVFSHPQANLLIPLHNDDYPFVEHIEDTLCRRSRRTGMILNSEELAGFVHLPSSEVRSPTLLRDAGLTKAAPASVRKAPGVVIGDNEHDGNVVPVYLNPDQRVRHTHVIGSSGTGKSSLLFNLIQQDIENGEGVAVLDPHGDLITQILSIVPDDRIDDVVLVDPSDVEFPIGFNILSAHSDEEKNLLASDLIAVFRRLATSWGDQMDTVLQNAILAFLESTKGGTLSDLRLFLLDQKYRKQFLQTVSDPEIVFYWQNVFPQLTGGKSIGPVLTRLQDFFSRKPLRNMVGQEKNKLDFADIMDSGKIFLARLPEGCGEENSYLLGTLLVSKFQQLAMARHSQAASARRDFWLYIDEFDHFITPSMAKILSGVRKYRLGLVLAHQELFQLRGDPKVESAVLTQPCTRIVFKVGDDDAKKLGEGFESFDAKSLKNLEKFHAIARVERNDYDFNLAIRKSELPDEAEATERRKRIVAASRERYGSPRQEVETALLSRIWGEKSEPTKSSETRPPKPSTPPTAAEPIKANLAPDAPVIPEVPKTVSLPVPEPQTVTVSGKEKIAVVPPSAASSPPMPAQVSSSLPKDDGRGGARHKSIQKRLKTEAEKLGFSAEVEKQLTKGAMPAADLILRRGHVAIAVEITVTTGADHEFGNVKKCLDAGFSRVTVVSTRRKHLEVIAEAVLGGLGPDAAAKVNYCTPDEFLDELRQLAAASELPPATHPLPPTETVDGFEVERSFPQQSKQEQKSIQKNIHEIVTKAMTTPSLKRDNC